MHVCVAEESAAKRAAAGPFLLLLLLLFPLRGLLYITLIPHITAFIPVAGITLAFPAASASAAQASPLLSL